MLAKVWNRGQICSEWVKGGDIEQIDQVVNVVGVHRLVIVNTTAKYHRDYCGIT